MDKWIKPSDALPESGQAILFVGNGKSYRLGNNTFLGLYSAAYNEFYCDADEYYTGSPEEILCWILQPKLPDWALEYFGSEYDAN